MTHRLLAFFIAIPAVAFAQGTPADYERSAKLGELTRNKVFRDRVEPHWFNEGTEFWYRVDLAEGAREFIRVDATKGQRGPAFDHAKLAVALAKAAGKDVKSTHLPFDLIAIDGPTIRFNAFDKGWAYSGEAVSEGTKLPVPKKTGPFRKGPEGRPPEKRDDGPWTVAIRDHNIYLKSKEGAEFQLTTDGTAKDYYEHLFWSPDHKKLVAMRTRTAEMRQVKIVASSPRDQLQPKLISLNYAKPGDPLPVSKPHLFDVEARKEIPVPDELFPNPWELDFVKWDADGKTFTFTYNQRGHQVLRFIEVDATTGKARVVINEESKTFIDYAHKQYLHEVPGTGELIWMSERSGWNHLYLIDRPTGAVKNPVTHGNWLVRGVDRVDNEKRQIWFRAGAIDPKQDPYHVHYCRINFDGTGLVRLTEGDGNHSLQYSPGRKHYIDTYSRVDRAPISELRNGDDGKLICNLESADITALERTGWKVPERFVAKGRDDTTEIHGVIWRPTTFDSAKKYPVIEKIYAGPQDSFVPKSFRPMFQGQEIAELGFVVVQIDGMGTSNRSKAFHDVCAKNLGDAGFPDRILWLKSAAAKYPYLDLTRVGIFGGSAGGQNALRALLAHGDFYKVAVADCGCHDNRMDKVWWNELWMGYPVGPHYTEQSNVTQAHRLTGKLLLTVGEVDQNVDPASTMQVVNALIKANKDFDLLVVPNGGHGIGESSYGARRRKDFFVRHLLGVEPPDRNAEIPKKTEPPKSKEPEKKIDIEVPDLKVLMANTGNEVRGLARQYEADWAALQRRYNLPSQLADNSRLRKFNRNWEEALTGLDAKQLSPAGAEGLTELKKQIAKDAGELNSVWDHQGEISAFVAFAADLYRLEMSRRALEPIDPTLIAERLNSARNSIDEANRNIAAAKDHRFNSVVLTKARIGWVIEEVNRLRDAIQTWHTFYSGYDPLFTWWVGAPYRELDAALDRFAKTVLARSEQAPESTPVRARFLPNDVGPTDIPDAKTYVAPASEFTSILQRYQTDIERLRFNERGPLYTKWLDAIDKLDFDKLSPSAKIDFLLFRTALQRDTRRFANRPKDPPARPKDGSDIVGRPIGREALLAALEAEMITYTPEQLVELANREYAWCEAEMKKAAREMGFGDDWRMALEKVKTLHVAPGGQPKVIRDLALEAIEYLNAKRLLTIPPIAAETWRMEMMTPERQKFNPFFTGGEVISVSFPTNTMSHEAKLQSLRGNNVHFSRATVHHELIPGHHLQQFMNTRYQPQRQVFATPFWTEGWAVYWEMVLYDLGFAKKPEDRIGLMFWRMHRCARVTFSLGFHLGKMTPQECIDFLVEKVGHERENATAEVRRSFQGGYPPLYQAGYLIGAKQFWALRQELVASGKMSDMTFHDAILKENHMPVELVRAILNGAKLTTVFKPSWKFAGELPDADWLKAK